MSLEPEEARSGRTVQFIALLEEIGAVLGARSIACAPRLAGLSVGGDDLALPMGAEPTPDVLRQPRLLMHYAAKEHGLPSIGMLRSTADYSDTAAIQAAASGQGAFPIDGRMVDAPVIARASAVLAKE